MSNLPILTLIFCHALYGYPSLKPIYLIFEHVIIGSVDLQFERQIFFTGDILLYWRFDSETLYDFWYKNQTLLLELQHLPLQSLIIIKFGQEGL